MSILKLISTSHQGGRTRFNLVTRPNGRPVFMVLNSNGDIVDSSVSTNQRAEKVVYNFCHGHDKGI